ncbi:MAG: acetoacetyl-CoA reductase [Dokdonella sp.]|jgi:acetoacetyl-CoA reductase|uniref:acetoacetyl-CoA reductase n=1 Tax=Dokdonella sp. TaxID=2291710 RepID=UPI001B501311|nr:acetoacetyl-CoA reductase [Dokdonella sp.]MCC6440030.1 acetoacetyl-CoA reductase [Rhodanobacteraceae bacterium]MBP6328704.1 acetoacetyl-CoA reductase [Dokdonella sp.]HNV08663.1 acetoacetyl-CoA reductase [Dokdonella sp.]HPW02653.1 acetoacetyl-CoA reductase [Dokdonella sp.]HQV48034.1 acetoacetyl-CoA reductase [Dokdonella sp.]
MNKQLALVTGGIGGLGTEICRQLAKSGKRVIAADLGSRSDRVSEFLDEVSEFSDDISFEPLDVSSFEECTTSLKAITDKHGPISILVNAAGITRDTSLRKMSERQWSDVITVNLDGVFNTCRALVDGMTERGFGRIVNISSVNGQTGQFGQTNYSAAKAGMHGFTMALAREVARKGVTVNSVSPGYCETALVMAVPQAVREQIVANIPVGRLGKPKEIARVVDFLCADDSGFITGANIPVNGGYFMDF